MDAEPQAPGGGPSSRTLGVKVGMLLAFTIVVAVAFVAYVLYARGIFEQTQRLTLIADNVEGVSVGMDLTFAGFPIGRVRRLSLSPDGKARIHVRIPRSQTHWLRATSVFTLERSLIGAARLRAFTGDLKGAPLPDRAVREVLRGDVTEEIPRVVASVRSVLEHAEQLTGPGSALALSLADLRQVTRRMTERRGVSGALLGADQAEDLARAVARTNTLLEQLAGAAKRADALLGRATGLVGNVDERVFGDGGMAADLQRAMREAAGALAEARARLRQLDRTLENAEALSGDARAVGAEVRAATTDLKVLRAEVDDSLRKLGALLHEINRKWPFAREPALELP